MPPKAPLKNEISNKTSESVNENSVSNSQSSISEASTSVQSHTSIVKSLSVKGASENDSLDTSTKSKTLEDLLETLKELEKVEKFPSPPQTDVSYNSENSVATLVEVEEPKCKKYLLDLSFKLYLNFI